MSTVLENKPAARSGVADKPAFFNGLQSVTNTIHSTTHLARVSEMFGTAVEEGMRTLKQDGIGKVLMGVTDIHQVRSVCIK